jgi:hypothetical protein
VQSRNRQDRYPREATVTSKPARRQISTGVTNSISSTPSIRNASTVLDIFGFFFSSSSIPYLLLSVANFFCTELCSYNMERYPQNPKRILFFKPMSWLGQIRSHRRDETWSASLWQTFFSTSMGAQIPVIAEKPLATCGCRQFQLDPLGDHLNTCTTHSGAKKAHDWMVDQIADLFRTTHRVKTQQVVKAEVSIVVTSSWRDI